MTPLGWSGWDHDRVMLSTVRLTWCMMDTADGAGREVRGYGSEAGTRGCTNLTGAQTEYMGPERGRYLTRAHSLPRGLMGQRGLCGAMGAALMRHP